LIPDFEEKARIRSQSALQGSKLDVSALLSLFGDDPALKAAIETIQSFETLNERSTFFFGLVGHVQVRHFRSLL